jgi:hypothetical protein
MKTKFLLYAAITFLILGLRIQDGELYYFFAVYLAALALGVSLYKWEDKIRRKNTMTDPPPSTSLDTE